MPTHVSGSDATAAAFGCEMEPLPATKLNVHERLLRGLCASAIVNTHAPPVPAATEYVMPGTDGNAEPPLKSATATPVTAVSKVAVTRIVVSDVVVGPDDDDSVGLGGEYWSKNPLLDAAPFLGVTLPLSSGMVTDS